MLAKAIKKASTKDTANKKRIGSEVNLDTLELGGYFRQTIESQKERRQTLVI